MNLPEWKPDGYGGIELKFIGPKGPVHAFISPRPSYCDRGHWQFGIMSGVPSLDGADSFPRYYMHLSTAIKEANDWINWRLYKKRQELPQALVMNAEGGVSSTSYNVLSADMKFEPAGEWREASENML